MAPSKPLWWTDGRLRLTKYVFKVLLLSRWTFGTTRRRCIVQLQPSGYTTSLHRADAKDVHTGHMGMKQMKPLDRQMCCWFQMETEIAKTSSNTNQIALTLWPDSHTLRQQIHRRFLYIPRISYYQLVLEVAGGVPDYYINHNGNDADVEKPVQSRNYPTGSRPDNGFQFCAIKMKTCLDSIGFRHQRTVP